jgi:hypothetical protein
VAHSTAGPYTRTSIESNILAVILCFRIDGALPNYIGFAEALAKTNIDAEIVDEPAKLTRPVTRRPRRATETSHLVDPVSSAAPLILRVGLLGTTAFSGRN